MSERNDGEDEKVAMILRVVDGQEPMLFLVDGQVWEGHITSCLMGELVAVVRLVGTRTPRIEQRWRLDAVTEMARGEPDGDEPVEDELLARARGMIEQAREYSELTLAERVLRDHRIREQ
jgi:hypothetical protein